MSPNLQCCFWLVVSLAQFSLVNSCGRYVVIVCFTDQKNVKDFPVPRHRKGKVFLLQLHPAWNRDRADWFWSECVLGTTTDCASSFKMTEAGHSSLQSHCENQERLCQALSSLSTFLCLGCLFSIVLLWSPGWLRTHYVEQADLCFPLLRLWHMPPSPELAWVLLAAVHR